MVLNKIQFLTKEKGEKTKQIKIKLIKFNNSKI